MILNKNFQHVESRSVGFQCIVMETLFFPTLSYVPYCVLLFLCVSATLCCYPTLWRLKSFKLLFVIIHQDLSFVSEGIYDRQKDMVNR